MNNVDIFIGPIVRRSHIGLIVIQLATFKYFNLNFSVRKKGEADWLGHDLEPRMIQAAPNLFFYFAQIVPLEGTAFPTKTLLEYSIALMDSNYLNPDYSFFEKIVKEDSLAYKDFLLPTLFLQSPSQPLNALYGSCRKIHDVKGDVIDALFFGDGVIMDNLENLDTRPGLLCLGGDQIYADDVAPEVLERCIDIAMNKLGLTKEDIGIKSPLPGVGDRKKFVTINAGFTSGEADNHLITFGEYIALYGLMWNVSNWTLPMSDDLFHFTSSLKYVRRLMANVPTYMIFDDHDVTDDWNISLKWVQNVQARALGRRIIANALASFFLCQGYGNQPSKFTMDQHHQIARVIIDKDKIPLIFDRLFSKINWEFYTPTTPFIYFLDTRTQRGHKDFKRTNTDAPAFLKSMESWRKTTQNLGYLLSKQKSDLPLVLVSAAPIFGFSVVEKLQEIISSPNLAGPYFLDLESWAANEDHLRSFLTRMADKNVVIISGDVHYSFTSTVKFETFDDKFYRQVLKAEKGVATIPGISGITPSYKRILQSKYIQLTSSSLKNFADDTKVKIPAYLTSRVRESLLLESGEKIKGKYENGTFYKGIYNPLINSFTYSEIDSQVLKPSCFLKQSINNAFNSGYIGGHNIGLLSINRNEVTNCFYTVMGKISEHRWNFSNPIYWE